VTITLITGGNKGLGREAARRLIGLGHTVYLGARDAGHGQAAAGELGARFLPLDVTGDASVTAAAAELTRREGRLDVLINNAGVFEGLLKPEEITAADAERIFAVNVSGTGHQSVQEGTDAIVRLATIGPDGPSGTLLSRTGPVPW
jgi:NAD(P)-dependent dehydrogenase (short-subunit alcohol dehydrogenase family)